MKKLIVAFRNFANTPQNWLTETTVQCITNDVPAWLTHCGAAVGDGKRPLCFYSNELSSQSLLLTFFKSAVYISLFPLVGIALFCHQGDPLLGKEGQILDWHVL
jgi:hypothetical protein